MAQPSRIDALVRACISLKESTQEIDAYGYGPSVCAHCRGPVTSEGQSVEKVLAAREGVYFRVKVPCPKCKCSLGFVSIDLEVPDVSA